jgi:hypothetical protein
MKTITFSRMKSFISMIIVSCLFTACHHLKKRQDQINRIEIATGGCLRGCPVIGISIDSTLRLKYYGGYKAKLQGYYSGFVTQGFWDTLNVKLKQINFKKLDTSKYYELDGEVDEVIFYWDKQKRHIFKSVDDDPDAVSHVLIWIADSYKHIQLQKSNDTLKFETTYQFMMPPKPKLVQIKFPPPKKIK